MTKVLQLEKELGLRPAAICHRARLAFRSFTRWQERLEKAETPVQKPGPAPEEMPDCSAILGDLRGLPPSSKAKPKRLLGSGEILEKYRKTISRREFQEMVDEVRMERIGAAKARERRLTWHGPGWVWAMDTTEIPFGGKKIFVHTILDLASRYKIAPFTEKHPCGEEVAGWLEAAFHEQGAPLFLKFDNASIHTHPAVVEVLRRYQVLPLPSPEYYPQYNGAVEHAQNDIQKRLNRDLMYRPPCPPEHM